MDSERTVYFGSFFEWTKDGQQLIENFQANCDDPDNTPFVSYDQSLNVFSIKTNDLRVVQTFGDTLHRLIEYTESLKFNRAKIDNLTHDLVRPIDGTTLPEFNDTVTSNGLRESGDLINIDNDSDDDSTDNTSSSGGVPSLYWTPECGDIAILPDDTAMIIATMTDCMLYKEPESRKVRLMNGNVNNALEKLKRMEPLLEYLARHRDGEASRVNHNILSLSSQNPGRGVVYSPINIIPHCDRVLVGPALHPRLDKMLIGEEYTWDTRRWAKSANLNVVGSQEPTTRRESSIWNNYSMPTTGNPDKALPRTTSADNLTVLADRAKSTPLTTPRQPSRFMPVLDQARLREWNRNVDLDADPAIAADEPIEAEPFEAPASKRVVENSDTDSDEMLPPPTSVSTNPRLIAFDSDEESLPRSQHRPENQRTQSAKPGMLASAARPQRQSPQSAQVLTGELIPVSTTSGALTAREARRQRFKFAVDPMPTVSNEANQYSKPQVIAAQDFFADLPRDEPDGEVAESSRSGGNPVQEKTNVTTQFQDTDGPNKSPRRISGFDGAADEPEYIDTTISQPKNKHVLARTIPASPLLAQQSILKDASPSYLPSAGYGTLSYGTKRPCPQQQDRQAAEPPKTVWDQVEADIDRHPDKLKNESARHQRYRSQDDLVSNHQVHFDGVDSLPEPGQRTNTRPQHRQLQQKTQQPRRFRYANQLVDVHDNFDTQTKPLEPPPGLNYHHESRQNYAANDLLDSPLGEIQRAPIKPSMGALPIRAHEAGSLSTSSSAGGIRNHRSEYNSQTVIPKPDIGLMKDATLHMLLNSQNSRQRKIAEPVTVDNSSHRYEKVADEDEAATRRFHTTMNLKAPNPGKSKKKGTVQASATKETAAERSERIAKAKAEAFGITGPKAQLIKQVSSHCSNTRSDQYPSRRVREIAKTNPLMAAAHALILETNERIGAADDLVEAMRPFFEAARFFSGALEFEIQIGQVLVDPHLRLEQRSDVKKAIEVKKWQTIFGSPNISPNVSFSSILTHDGADIDGILEVKQKGNRAQKLWNKTEPGPTDTSLEFRCFDTAGTNFRLILQKDGSHSVQNDPVAIGKVAIHCPGRVWDACATLKSTSRQQYPDEKIAAAVEELVSSIYINAEKALTVYFRTPANNAIMVGDVVLRRTSLHGYQGSEQSQVRLKISETKSLFTRSHRLDKRLHFCTERPYEMMTFDHQVHFEVGIVHVGINNILAENEHLEAGESTSAETTGPSLLTSERGREMVDVTLQLIDKIDWVGRNNYGSLVKAYDDQSARKQEMERTLPPMTNPLVPRPIGHSIAGPRTAIAGARTNIGPAGSAPTVALPVHGVRARTQAQVYQDESGNLFKFGLGAARIPVSREDESNIGGGEILPNESASQYGGPSHRKGNAARGQVPGFEDKPSNFW